MQQAHRMLLSSRPSLFVRRCEILPHGVVARPARMFSISLPHRTNQVGKYLTHSTRTSITSALWQKRDQLHEEQLNRLRENSSASSTESEMSPSFLLEKKASDSAVEILLPFSSDLALREQYINFYGNLRMGKILEDLDACAANIAFMHADDNNPNTRPLALVTASVERIDLLNKLFPDRDMRMTGCVAHVGRSSMEVRVELDAKDPATERFYPLVLATFTMVATFNGKPAPVNRLVPQTEREKQLFELGEKNKKYRKELAKASLEIQPPTTEEQVLIHNIFMNSLRGDSTTDTVQMASTRLQSVILCQPQERNKNNKIFGGFLMQKAHELAWTTAHTHCRMRPWFLALDHVTFHQPVSIGSIIYFGSEIVYTHSHALGVRVIAEVHNPLDGSRDKTNSFHFTFTCPDAPVKQVVPNTYDEAMRYLEGKRRYDEGKRIAQSLDSALLKYY